MEIHKLLKRQLQHTSLAPDKKPETDEQWQTFIQRINNTYIDADQERYLHERSIKISSREMMSLNEKLAYAQHIAGLGYWSYDGIIDRAIWSNELFSLFHLNPQNKAPSLDEFMKLVHEQDQFELRQKVQRSLEEKIDYECEIRIKNSDGNYRWYRIISQCQQGEKQLAGIIIDIHKSKAAEEKIKELNQQISSTARRAGMAEVATTILHNIGNILNSSNVSITILKNSFKLDYHKKLLKIMEMMENHQTDLVHFLTHDPKGKIIPQYLLAIGKIIMEENEKNNLEVENLQEDLRHITQIVDTQKSISGLSSLNEKVYLPELIDTAMSIIMNSSKKKDIQITKNFNPTPMINVDKSKLLQILINLIQNAKDSVLENTSSLFKEIKLKVQKKGKKWVEIIVEDNGVGINADNLQRIFAFGFTTKKNGHGIGLHSSAISAREMGGSLIAASKGEGYGAQFLLTLPINDSSYKQGGPDE
ncbi:ATP-binding protein [Fluoribacter dumoffii]|uniref:histidine kinase n=1 Tax=Fluoribacter dumoffii TaxID=463 RepID=A0A377GAI5_9GAMM|nr:PAS domain-containing sensor histidine kinase [Fluoribacter dumoffii]KTC88778.1 Two-component sensor histidine kinase [Fluoribacter dumoffii NY 23]MCW8495779.1 ATP-binding protein [Fluoribacter dumoffii]STO21734.1 Sensor protein fixL [Fluoribacter dumoffii]